MNTKINIQDIIGNVLKDINVKDDDFGGIEDVFFSAIDPKLGYYIKVIEVIDKTVIIGVKSNIVYSEIIGFRKTDIEKNVLPKLKKYEINEIRYRLIS